MATHRWTSRKVVVVGPSGREAPAEARLRTPEESGLGTVVSIALMACLVAISFFFPPVLLLNIPILVFRAAVSQALAEREHRVTVGAFACPDCVAPNMPEERRGTLPLELTCPGCDAPLVVRPPPRRNLVVEPPI
jgi:hypothetical protein